MSDLPLAPVERELEAGNTGLALTGLERLRERAYKRRDLTTLNELVPLAARAQQLAESRRDQGKANRLVYALEQNIKFVSRLTAARTIDQTPVPASEVDEADIEEGVEGDMESFPEPMAPATVPPPSAAAPGPAYCSNCGMALTGQPNFCPSCGTAVARPEPPRRAALAPALAPTPKKESRVRKAMVDSAFGAVHPAVVCPHCATRGHVRMKPEKVKKGVSGGKATAALLTGGASLLATGLSRKGHVTAAFCEACGTKWTIE